MRAHPAFGVDAVYEAHICSGLFFGGVSPSVLSIPDVARHFDFKASYMIVVGDVLAPPSGEQDFWMCQILELPHSRFCQSHRAQRLLAYMSW